MVKPWAPNDSGLLPKPLGMTKFSKVGSKLNEITRARDDKLDAFMVLSTSFQVRNWECTFEVSSVVSRQARASRRSYYDLNST